MVCIIQNLLSQIDTSVANFEIFRRLCGLRSVFWLRPTQVRWLSLGILAKARSSSAIIFETIRMLAAIRLIWWASSGFEMHYFRAKKPYGHRRGAGNAETKFHFSDILSRHYYHLANIAIQITPRTKPYTVQAYKNGI